ncbi:MULTISPECIES: MobB family relaxase [Flavobacteriaceae]|uniref:MobB family relaxase n=1 Tax=Flavobacteriaceae TaxID=49546 RepID=UPI0014932357|nr:MULTISPECIES: MobB family relaxase [Allomuricauda]MDC6367197.1 MobB family relaxase [Muricauda sp. AC10]
MVVKIHNPKHTLGKNQGSCGDLVEYLDKENRDVPEMEHEHFFNHDGEHFSAAVVEREIDNNKGKLSSEETKFYMLTVNPSKAELEHLKGIMEAKGHDGEISDERLFQEYIKDVMDKYAENFNREFSDGRPLTGDDILYYAKIEHERTYKHNERRYEKEMQHNKAVEKKIYQLKSKIGKDANPKQIKDLHRRIDFLDKNFKRNAEGTIIKEGNLKDGKNLHAHIIVSRMDKSQQIRLSPMANHRQSKNKLNGKEVKIGFNRDEFVGKCESLFDEKFQYKRDYTKSYNYYKEAKDIRTMGNLLHLTNPKVFAKMAYKRAMSEMIADKTLQRQMSIVVTDPRKIPKKLVGKLETKAIEAIVAKMGAAAYTNPVTAGVQVAKQAISMAAKTVSKGMGI